MDYIYVLICDNGWEDTIVFLSEEDAIRESIHNSNYRIEIFSKNTTCPGYIPTYNYYKNGKYITSADK